MDISELPVGSAPRPVNYPYFPTVWQHVLWRNWGLVPAEDLAALLKCRREEITTAARELGLDVNCPVDPKWRTCGYLTLLRNNWQLLGYRQLLELLKWNCEQLAYSLKEEDFLFIKFGQLKPNCPEVRYTELTPDEREKTRMLRENLRKHFPDGLPDYEEEPFAFTGKYGAKTPISGTPKFKFNFIHSYAANCGDVLRYADTLDPAPENLLAQYQSMGIKGVWFHALLYLLCPIPGAEEYSEHYQLRLNNLRRLVARGKKYGIDFYLYLNEPRCMPLDFYTKKPLWAGVEEPELATRCICTTASPEPLEYLEQATCRIFTEVPGLGGVFTITQSENPTNCHTHLQKDRCPSCAKVAAEQIISAVNCAIERGMHRAAPEAKMIIYDWAWQRDKQAPSQPTKHTVALPEESAKIPNNTEFKRDVINLLPRNAYLNCVSEWGNVIRLGGTAVYQADYSISHGTPSPESLSSWRSARARGMKACAKVQINNSWELSAVPYIPVPYLIEEHLEKLRQAGVEALMLSWTLGGYPGGNLELLNATPEEIARQKYHPELAQAVCLAQKQFSDAFREYPFSTGVAYHCPANFGPMNVLHLQPTGYTATMIGFPYDDLEGWRGPYPEEVFEEQFRKLSEQWQSGLDTLKAAEALVRPKEKAEFTELQTMAIASYCHLRSTFLQIAFTRLRNHNGSRAQMRQYVAEELELAKTLHDIVRKDSRIGFEASGHYYYTLNDLREKILNCEYLLTELQ